MAKTVKTNQLPVVNDLTGAKVIGLDKDGKDAQFPLQDIVRSERGVATPAGSPTGTRFAGETWTVSTANLDVAYPNWGGLSVPSKVGELYSANNRFVWNNGAWSLQRELLPIPPAVVGDNSVTQSKIAKSAVSPEKTTFIQGTIGKNLANPAEFSAVNNYVEADNGLIIAQTSTGNRATGYIPIAAGEKHTLSSKSELAYYDINKVYISGDPSLNLNGVTITGPAGVAFYRTTVLSAAYSTFQIEKGEQKTTFEPYKLTQSIPDIEVDKLSEAGKSQVRNMPLIATLEKSMTALSYVNPDKYQYTSVVENDANVVASGAFFSAKAHRAWLKGIAPKKFNTITIPLPRDFKTNTFFTDSITVKIFLGNVSLTKTIPLSVLEAYNLLPSTSPASAFDHRLILDSPLMLLPGDILFVGWEADGKDDLIGSLFKLNDPASDAAEYTQNYTNWANTAGFVKDLKESPDPSSRGKYYYRVSLGYAETSQSLINPDIIMPKKVYTVANNVNTGVRDNLRNSAAVIWLDHGLTGFTSEPDLKFEESGNDKVIFMSPIQVLNGNSPESSAINYNVDNSIVRNEIRAITVKGVSAMSKQFSIKHVSTLASVGKLKFVFELNLGDSTTWGESAFWPGEGMPTYKYRSYSLLLKELLEKDRIDNGSVAGEYENRILGTFKRTLDFEYAGSTRTVTACHEGRQGWTIDQYLSNSNGNKFWDPINNRFSIKYYVDKYRTLSDTGVRLAANDPTKGTLVTDVNAFDVCIPTHINIMLGANGNDTAAQFVAKLNTLIAEIKADYANNGWGSVKIIYSLFDSAGTYFPSRHPSYGKNIAFWNNSTASDPHRGKHERYRSIMKEWLDTHPNDTEDADGVYLCPLFWTMPTADSACIRRLDKYPGADNYLGYESYIYEGYRWAPYVHLNPNAHATGAYQLYSLIRYTQSL